MPTARVQTENHVVRQVLYQDVNARLLRNQRHLDGLGFTPDQVHLAGRVVAIMVMRRTMSREDARRMTPRGLAAIAALIRPDAHSIEEVLADGVVRKAHRLLQRGPIPAPTQTHAALSKATILINPSPRKVVTP